MASNDTPAPAEVEAPESNPFEATGNPGSGVVRVSGNVHPFRLFDGRVEYQLRSGEWREVPDTYDVL